MQETFKNILVVRTDRIGDVVLTTPALAGLRRAFPSARLTVLTSPATRVLLEGHPDVDRVICDDRTGAHRGTAGFCRLAGMLRAERFDLAVIFHTKRRTNALCALAGIPARLGYRDRKWGFLLTLPVPDERATGEKHECDYCLDLVRTIGAAPAGRQPAVSRQPDAEQWAREFFQARGWDAAGARVAALHPGASDPSKQWPSRRFAELAAVLHRRFGCTIVVIGSRSASPQAADIARRAGVPVTDLTGNTTLAQTVSFLARCALLVSNDSGPVHLADAVGTPVVALFTRAQPGINAGRWGPLGQRSRAVVARLDGTTFPEGRVTDPADLDRIPLGDVVEAVDAVFKLC